MMRLQSYFVLITLFIIFFQDGAYDDVLTFIVFNAGPCKGEEGRGSGVVVKKNRRYTL